MQIGIDQKIYIVKIFGSHLDRIENPNEYGANLIHTDSAVYLGGVLSTLGLPDFIQSYFRPAYFDYTSKCGLPVKFQAQNHLYDSLRWDFGDSASASNTDTAAKTQHQYPGTGWYTVRLIVHSDSSADTFSRLIFSRSSEIFVAQKDTIVVCEQDSTALSSHRSNSTTQYIWNTGDTIDSIEVNLFGTYFCTVTSPCDSVVDTFIVVYASPPTLNLDSHAVICEGDTLFLTAENGQQSSFLWSTGDTTSQIAVGSWLSPNLDELEISVTASNVCLSITDTILIGFIPLPNASLPPDTNQCLNESIFLQHEALSEVTYYWSDSSQALAFRVDSTSLVWLSASNMCGTDRDSILVTFHPEMEVELGPNAQICAGQEVILNASWPQSSYQWNQVPAGQSISDSVLFVQDAGNYIVTITNGPCALVEQQEITLIENCDSTECKFSIPNVFSPNADGINDLLDISNACKTLAYDIYIYNRWGQLVHFSTEAFSSWDGFINGVPASSGTYFLMVEYQDENGQPRYQKASFALVR
jgi:gliding motility-associated-like protein